MICFFIFFEYTQPIPMVTVTKNILLFYSKNMEKKANNNCSCGTEKTCNCTKCDCTCGCCKGEKCTCKDCDCCDNCETA